MTVRRLFVALFAIALFTIAVRETLDPDMWWHLRTGEYILQEGIPRYDVFSFTVPDHAWTTHEWLSQVVMWGVYRVGGLPGLIVVFAGLTAVSFFLVYRVSEGRPFLAAFVVLLAAFASAMIWGVRPQIFNSLFLAVFVYMAERYRQGDYGGRVLWWLPVLTLVWANFHSGYLLGVVFLTAFTVGEGLETAVSRGANANLLTWRQIRGLMGITAVSFLAAAINPNGPELWIYPFLTLGSSAMQAYILEWHSPDFHQAIFWPFLALGALGVFGWTFAPRRPRYSDLLLFGGTALAGFVSLRNIPLFAIIAPPIVCRALVGWLSLNPRLAAFLREPTAPSHLARWQAAMNGVVLGLAALVGFVWTWNVISKNETAVAAAFPVTAVTYLEESGLAEQRGFNSYNWGGYLIWRRLPVFIDGRADVYGDEFMFFYRQAYDAGEQWAEPLTAYQVDYVLMERGQPLNSLLALSPDWDEVYRDELSQIFVRVAGGP